MIIRKIKELFKESQTRKIYYRIRKIPIVKIFFDFDYAGQLWRKSFFHKNIQSLVEKTGLNKDTGKFLIKEKYLPYFLCGCVYSLIFQEFWIVPLTLITASLSVPYIKNKSVVLAMIFLLALAVIFVSFVNFSGFFYIIYVETGIVLFFIIKYLSEDACERFIQIASMVWVVGTFDIFSQSASAFAVLFLPYAITVFKRGKIRKYFYGAILLGIGFYILSKAGRSGIIGGSAEAMIMLLSGEWWLLFPIAFVAPATLYFVGELLNENIIATGYFLWRYGFGGASVGYGTGEDGIEHLKIISYIIYTGIFVFFWYVLRLSRSAIKKLFKKQTKNNKFLRSGMASLVGFSLYTFFAYNENPGINIILYLVSAGLLKRTDDFKV